MDAPPTPVAAHSHTNAAHSTVLSLPSDVTRLIFGYSSEHVRLLVLALVCKKWSTVAHASVTTLRLPVTAWPPLSLINLTRLSVAVNNKHALESLHLFTRLEALHLFDIHPCVACAPLADVRLHRLRDLSVEQRCNHASEMILHHAWQLTRLAVGKLMPLKFGAGTQPVSFPRLRSLAWEYDEADDPMAVALLRALPGLTELKVTLPDRGAPVIALLPMTSITRLELVGPFTADAMIAAVQLCPALVDLAFRPRKTSVEGRSLPPTLTELDLSQTFSPAHYYIDALVRTPRLTKLVMLNALETALLETHWQGPVARMSAHLRDVYLPPLKCLAVPYLFSTVRALTALTTLRLNVDSVSDAEVLRRLSLSRVTTVHIVTIRQIPLTESAALLRVLLPCVPNLRSINMASVSRFVFAPYTDDELQCVDSMLTALAQHGVQHVQWPRLGKALGGRLRALVYKYAWIHLLVAPEWSRSATTGAEH